MKIGIFLLACFLMGGTVFAEETLSLEQSIETAVSNNLQIAAGTEKISQAEYGKREVFTSFLPRLSSSFTYTRLDEAQTMEFSGMSFQVTDADLYNFGLTLSQPLYTGGRLSAVYSQARENVQRTVFEKETAVQNLVLDVKKGYFSILKAGRGVQTVNSLKEMALEHLKTAEAFFREGLVTKADVLKTEVFLADTEQQILQTENGLALSKAGFSFLLNRPLSSEFEVEDILERRKEENNLEYWTKLSYERRSDLKELESASKIYGYGIEAEKSAYKPQVAFFSNYLMDWGTEGAVGEWKDSWNLGVALDLDIWNWGETKYKVRKASHQKKEMDVRYSLLRKSIELEVKSAYLNLETAGRQIDAAKKSLEKSEESLRVANLLYKEGMSTTADVLDAQTDLTAARNKYYQALYDYQLAYAGLEKASGVGGVQ